MMWGVWGGSMWGLGGVQWGWGCSMGCGAVLWGVGLFCGAVGPFYGVWGRSIGSGAVLWGLGPFYGVVGPFYGVWGVLGALHGVRGCGWGFHGAAVTPGVPRMEELGGLSGDPDTPAAAEAKR